VVLRSYLRQRQMLIRYSAQHVQHMQKALEQMNVKLTMLSAAWGDVACEQQHGSTRTTPGCAATY
jgi:hypothetical protein